MHLEVGILAELQRHFVRLYRERHKRLIAELRVLDLLKGGDGVVVGFDVVLEPLEGGADVLDVVL